MGAWDPRPALRSDLGYRISPFQGLGQDANAGHWVVRVGTPLKRDTDIGTGTPTNGDGRDSDSAAAPVSAGPIE